MKKSIAVPLSKLAGALRGLLLVVLSFVSLSCRHTADVPIKAINPQPVSTNALSLHETKIEPLKGLFSTSFVHIQGDDIQMPISSGPTTMQENRTYSFYVWAYDPELSAGKTLLDMMGKEFSLEVVGVNAKFLVPDYMPADPNGRYGKLLSETNVWTLQSRNVIEVQVNSRDIHRSFSIVAWFPKKYAEHQHQVSESATKGGEDSLKTINPFGARKDVRVYHGDLRTSIQIVSPEEVSASFGRHFHKYFYVGRVFFRNRHQDKRLMVYTTSMRANVLMYRKEDEKNGKHRDLTAIEREELMKRARGLEPAIPPALANKCVDETLALPLPAGDQRYRKAVEIVELIWSDRKKLKDLSKGSTAESDELKKRCIGLVGQIFELVDDEQNRLVLQQRRLEEDLKKVLYDLDLIKNGTNFNKSIQTKTLSGWLNSIVGRKPGQTDKFIENIDEAQQELGKSALMQAKDRNQLATMLNVARDKAIGIEKSAWLHRSLSRPETAKDIPDAYTRYKLDWERSLSNIHTRIRLSVTTAIQSNPMDQLQTIRVNPANNALAYSENARLQRLLLENGMIWQDYYRPMTFQAVLNSLIFVHDRSWETRTVRFMESAARVAGGIAAMGTVFNELTSQGYTEGVNVFSTILLPEVSKQIMEDVNKSIRNLGDLSMDTVVVIPPNGAVDRYVFFPKGPIYNFVDEFNITDPGYIVRVDSSDVSAEALLIDSDAPIQAGELDSKTLVSRAINEGRASEAAEILKKAALEEKLRRFDLMTLAADIENLLGNTPITDPTAVKTPQRLEKERQVILMVRDFETKHGADKTGLIVSLLRKYNVDLFAQPPVIMRPESVDLPAGFMSLPIALAITDENTRPWNLKPSIVTNTNPDLVSGENIWLPPTANDENPWRMQVKNKATSELKQKEGAILVFQMENDAGRKATNQVKITVHPVQVKASLAGNEAADGVITITEKNEVKVFRAELPIYDASVEQTTITLTANEKINVLDGKAPLVLVPGKDGPTLRAEWRVDTSALPQNSTNVFLTLTLTPTKDARQSETKFNLKLKAP